MEDPSKNSDAILITGPTASGKSALALELARRHDGVVINADSMQVYDTLRVVTARPSEAEMQGVPHRLYGHVPAAGSYSTGDWLREMTALIARVKDDGRLPVVVGGTGLYFKALTGGLSEMPAIRRRSEQISGGGSSERARKPCTRACRTRRSRAGPSPSSQRRATHRPGAGGFSRDRPVHFRLSDGVRPDAG